MTSTDATGGCFLTTNLQNAVSRVIIKKRGEIMQHKLSEGPLLNEQGALTEAGYATSLVRYYHRGAIKAPKLRIKEWDYYYIGNDQVGIALTIADNSYMGLISVTFLDFIKAEETTKSVMLFMPCGRLKLPETSVVGDVSFSNKQVKIAFSNDGNFRHITCFVPNFKDKAALGCELSLQNDPIDTMVIATPFDKPAHFYYNQKINCLHAMGNVTIGETTHCFDEALGVLDWGRGVWTYKNTWYWSSLSTRVGEYFVGFNLGYGFGITDAATENMLFLNGVATKIDHVTFKIPLKDGKEDYLAPWTFTSSDGSLNLRFEPIIDRHSNTSLGIIASNQHQVFGRFYGTLVFSDQTIELNGALGFAEKVMNKW